MPYDISNLHQDEIPRLLSDIAELMRNTEATMGPYPENPFTETIGPFTDWAVRDPDYTIVRQATSSDDIAQLNNQLSAIFGSPTSPTPYFSGDDEEEPPIASPELKSNVEEEVTELLALLGRYRAAGLDLTPFFDLQLIASSFRSGGHKDVAALLGVSVDFKRLHASLNSRINEYSDTIAATRKLRGTLYKQRVYASMCSTHLANMIRAVAPDTDVEAYIEEHLGEVLEGSSWIDVVRDDA